MPVPFNTLAPCARFKQLSHDIIDLAQHFNRDPASIKLIAVSKGQPIEAIQALVAEGQRVFGENYWQEARTKMLALADAKLEWHFIGRLQSNKAKQIARHFNWVHSVDTLAIALALSKARPALLPPLAICLQVNLHAEPEKGGCAVNELETLAKRIAELPRLQLRGFMTVLPEQDTSPLTSFRKLASLQAELNQAGFALDTLSMGMSSDYPAAIEAGATMLRIGSRLFGSRNP